MSRCQQVIENYTLIHAVLESINHKDCRILQEDVRASLIDKLVKWYVDNCGPLNTPEVLQKGWKGFEDMDDLELIGDWIEIIKQKLLSDQELLADSLARDLESALDLKVKLAKNIFMAS